jgi:5'-3' exonuclease
MPSKVLVIDGQNAFWRANIVLGPQKMHHVPCSGNFGEKCSHQMRKWHCNCGAQWNHDAKTCFYKSFFVVFNFFKNLRATVETFKPEKIFFVLEGRPKFRYELYPEYKANRIVKTAEDVQEENQNSLFYEQVQLATKILRFFPVTIVRAQDYECDDVIATLVRDMSGENVVILSSDSDFTQLLQEKIEGLRVYNPIKKEFLEAPNYHYVAWKCLFGDKSDNIRGFMGNKTAQKTVLNPKKFKEFMDVEENRSLFNINKQLIELRSVPYEELEVEDYHANWMAVEDAFQRMEFNSIVNKDSWQRYIETFYCVRI